MECLKPGQKACTADGNGNLGSGNNGNNKFGTNNVGNIDVGISNEGTANRGNNKKGTSNRCFNKLGIVTSSTTGACSGSFIFSPTTRKEAPLFLQGSPHHLFPKGPSSIPVPSSHNSAVLHMGRLTLRASLPPVVTSLTLSYEETLSEVVPLTLLNPSPPPPGAYPPPPLFGSITDGAVIEGTNAPYAENPTTWTKELLGTKAQFASHAQAVPR
ncbi:hypothetical protein ACKKBG_A26970 [Auxenochlorella protothecoides x Auxenochlorella symbiontica]